MERKKVVICELLQNLSFVEMDTVITHYTGSHKGNCIMGEKNFSGEEKSGCYFTHKCKSTILQKLVVFACVNVNSGWMKTMSLSRERAFRMLLALFLGHCFFLLLVIKTSVFEGK